MDENFITLVFFAVLIGLIPAAIANSKGKDFLGWWIFGAAIFILALPAALMLKPDEKALEKRRLQQGASKKCPYCAEIIKREAVVCRYCGKSLYQETSLPPQTTQPLTFCQSVAEFYKSRGHQIQKTVSVSKGIVDLYILSNKGESWLVRCISSGLLQDWTVARDFYILMQSEHRLAGDIITMGSFSSDAFKWVKGKPFGLINGERFSRVSGKYPPYLSD